MLDTRHPYAASRSSVGSRHNERSLDCSSIEVVPHPGLLCEAIARLSDDELLRMNTDEMVHLIQASPVVAREADGFQRLAWMTDRELRRIASLVRRCCRTRVNAYQRSQGQPIEWFDAC